MSKPRKKPASFAWRSLCASCIAFGQCLYSVFVLVLACITAFAAYVATLDNIPVPGFIIREVRDELQTQGVALRMDAISFQPNGRIIIEKPRLHSSELGATVAAADLAVARINPAHLLIGQVTLEQLVVSNGSFTLPALLTPSGLPETAVRSIDFEAERFGGLWKLHYADLALDGFKICLSGSIKQRFLRPPLRDPDKPRPSLTQTILSVAPKINRLSQELQRFDNPTCLIELALDESRRQNAHVNLLVDRFTATPTVSGGQTILSLFVHETTGADLSITSRSLALPRHLAASGFSLQASWDQLPDAENLLPDRIQTSVAEFSRKNVRIPSILATARPGEGSLIGNLQFDLADAPVSIDLERDLKNGETTIGLRAALSTRLPELLTPLSQDLASIDLRQFATISSPIDISAGGVISKDFQPIHFQAIASSGPLELLQAKVDRATLRARGSGPQIDLPEIRIHSGKQAAELRIGYNLETRLRRILVEGNVDPVMINNWFKPWWTAMWAGMEFSDEGLYAVLDSQAIFKQPETVRVTGIAHARDMNLRTLQVAELRTRFFSLFRYVDLYDIDLQTEDQTRASGNVQFHMDRDHRDSKDKLTGLWIDAISTLDVKRGPEVLWELKESVSEILEPYDYDTPPRIFAISESIRHQDTFSYNVDLDIRADSAFRFHDFPFQSLAADVHLENQIADIPLATAGLGDGLLTASAFILGDGMRLEAQLENANFSDVLLATNTYFAAKESEGAMKTDREELQSYGGTIDADFAGSGVTGDALSYEGAGSFAIQDANLVNRRLLGPISRLLENTPLMFTTLKFGHADGAFIVDRDTLRFAEAKLDGPVAGMRLDGEYNMEHDRLNMKARLFPFLNSKIPLISPLINITTQPFMSVVEFSITGPISEPKVSLFGSNPVTSEAPATSSRDARPTRR